MKSCFHLAAIFEFAVNWCEAWNPLLGMGVLRCSEDPIASRLDISGSEDSWLHNSHQFKTNLNIIFFKKALQGFQTFQICDTQAYVHHLITCANQKSIGSGNTRFFCFTCYAFKQPKQCLPCIITSSQAFFLWEKPWGREVRVASQRSCDGKERSCVFHIF